MIETGDRLTCVNATLSEDMLAVGAEYVVSEVMPPLDRARPCGLCNGSHDFLNLSRIKTRGWCPTRFRKVLPPRAVERHVDTVQTFPRKREPALTGPAPRCAFCGSAMPCGCGAEP